MLLTYSAFLSERLTTFIKFKAQYQIENHSIQEQQSQINTLIVSPKVDENLENSRTESPIEDSLISIDEIKVEELDVSKDDEYTTNAIEMNKSSPEEIEGDAGEAHFLAFS